jgi:hypothetical protein
MSKNGDLFMIIWAVGVLMISFLAVGAIPWESSPAVSYLFIMIGLTMVLLVAGVVDLYRAQRTK